MINELINSALSENADFDYIGRRFFAYSPNGEQKRQFLSAFLKRDMFCELSEVIHSGFINKQYNNSNYISSIADVNFDSRYFNLFLEIATDAGFEFEDIIKMLIYAFYADSTAKLYHWQGAIKAMLLDEAFKDYDKVEKALKSYDTKFRCYDVLLKCDKFKTVDILFDRLMHEKNINKQALRKFFLNNHIDIIEKLSDFYSESDAKGRASCVRLLLLFKNDNRVGKLLDKILAFDNSELVKSIIIKDANADKGEDLHGSRLKLYVAENSIRYDINIDSELNVSYNKTENMSAMLLKRLDKKCQAIKREIENRKQIFSDLMKSGESFSVSEFIKYIFSDKINSLIASMLFFSAYKDGNLTDILIVDDGKILDLDNQEVNIDEDKTIRVFHATELTSTYSYLRQLNIVQPFKQLYRQVYTANDFEKSSNTSIRLSGTIISAHEFIGRIKKCGFKMMNKDKDGEFSAVYYRLGDSVCVLEFTPTKSRQDTNPITIQTLKFFNYRELIRLGSQMYYEGVPLQSVKNMSDRTFSELLYAVYFLLGRI